MTQDEIIKLARQAGIDFDLIDDDEGQIWYITSEGLNAFATIVAAAEREACAKVCEAERRLGIDDERAYYGDLMATAIRARNK